MWKCLVSLRWHEDFLWTEWLDHVSPNKPLQLWSHSIWKFTQSTFLTWEFLGWLHLNINLSEIFSATSYSPACWYGIWSNYVSSKKIMTINSPDVIYTSGIAALEYSISDNFRQHIQRNCDTRHCSKRLTRAKFYLEWIPWGPVALEAPSDVTSHSKVQGN